MPSSKASQGIPEATEANHASPTPEAVGQGRCFPVGQGEHHQSQKKGSEKNMPTAQPWSRGQDASS